MVRKVIVLGGCILLSALGLFLKAQNSNPDKVFFGFQCFHIGSQCAKEPPDGGAL